MILDACCGSLKIYNKWHKNIGDDFISIDKRKGDFSYKYESNYAKSEIIIKPHVLADMRFLPFKEGCFDGIVCDPPHFDFKCETGFWAKKYGTWSDSELIRTLRAADPEFARVLKSNGFLFLKIMTERKNIYLELLRHFIFFLPIQLKRPRGAIAKNLPDVDSAVWYIGCKCEERQKVSFPFDMPLLAACESEPLFNSEKVENK